MIRSIDFKPCEETREILRKSYNRVERYMSSGGFDSSKGSQYNTRYVTCQSCGETVSVIEVENGICESCRTQ